MQLLFVNFWLVVNFNKCGEVIVRIFDNSGSSCFEIFSGLVFLFNEIYIVPRQGRVVYWASFFC